jgi:hypothetical protein
MARLVTLAQLRTDVAAQCDFVTSASTRYTPTLLTRLINQSIQRFRERVSATGSTHFLVSTSGVLAGQTQPYAFEALDLSSVSPSVVRVYGVDVTIQGVVRTLAHRPFEERNEYSDLGGGIPVAWSQYQTRTLAIMPSRGGDPYTVWYLPVLADLSADSDTFDGVSGWENWVVWDVICQLAARDQYDTALKQFTYLRDGIWDDIIRGAARVTSAGGAIVGRDTALKRRKGEEAVVGLSRGPTGAQGPAGPAGPAGAGGAGPTMLAAGPSGSMQYNSGSGFGGTSFGTDTFTIYGTADPANGLVAVDHARVLLGGRGVSGTIRALARWGKDGNSVLRFGEGTETAEISGRVATGGQLTDYINNARVRTLDRNHEGFVAGMRLGLAQLAHSGSTDKLSAVTASGFVNIATGIGITGSGIGLNPVALSVASLTAPLFSASAPGLVPTATSAGNFLKDDGTWAAAGGGGGGPTMLAAGPAQAVQYNSGSGFGGGSGFSYTGTQLSLDGTIKLSGSGGVQFGFGTGMPTAALIGFVPPSSNQVDIITTRLANNQPAQLLRWNAGTTGPDSLFIGAGTLAKLGFAATTEARWFMPGSVAVLNSGQLALAAPLRFAAAQNAHSATTDKLAAWTPSGFLNVATGINIVGSGLGLTMVSISVASLTAPLFGTSAPGLVPTATSAGNFLKDDGTWATPAGGTATGVSLGQLAPMASPRIRGRFTAGSGIPEELTGAQVASMLPVFVATGTPGLVPAPTGTTPSGMFLRDDGKWATPTGLGNGQFALMPPSTIKGTPGATGLPQDLVGSAVATLLPLFNDAHKGLVPGSGGGTANFLRSDGSWAAPSVAAGVSGVTFSQLQDISAPRFVGRFTGSGSMQEVTPLSAASMLPRMLGSGFGLVASPTLPVSGNFLRDDGTFATVGTGVTNAQLAPMPPQTIAGRFTLGSGVCENLTVPQVASMMPPFFASGARGVVLGPTGGAAGNFLRDDGSWQAVSSSGGGGPTMLAADPPQSVQFNAGSGFGGSSGFLFTGTQLQLLGDIKQPTGSIQLGALTGMPGAGLFRFMPTVNGASTDVVVTTSFSGSVAQLMQWNADGQDVLTQGRNIAVSKIWNRAANEHKWLVFNVDKGTLDAGQFGLKTGMRLGLPQLAHSGASDKLGALTASGFVNVATGISITGSGLGLSMISLAVASLTAPLFSTAAPGLVPTATSLGNFLKDDGTWATPAAGNATGVANSQLAPMPPLTLKGRFTLGSGVPEDLTKAQVASLLPLFTASGGSAGLVAPPTGGASGYFLGDDGAFFNIMPRVERKIGNIGSGVGSGFVVGSATVDFTTDPYQTLNIFGRTQFTLTPPARHRHVQLRMVCSASGHAPTFFPTAVRWMGGSGATPNWSTASGSVNFANFFYDGTIMWGQGAVGA